MADGLDDYGVENLGPAASVRTLPSNQQIATALGNIRIGTFDEPPAGSAGARAIIDIQGDSVLAFLPVRYRGPLRRLLSHDTVSLRLPHAAQNPAEPNQIPAGKQADFVPLSAPARTANEGGESSPVVLAAMSDEGPPNGGSVAPMSTATSPASILAPAAVAASSDAQIPGKAAESATPEAVRDSTPPRP